MIKFICFFIFLFPAIVIGQNPDTIIEDFNNDGYIDTLKSEYGGGSSFGGIYVALINGKTKEIFKLDSWGCFCDIKRVILIPPKLREASNKCFLDVMKKELLPEKRNIPDASLQWLITANENSKELSDNMYYNLLIKSPPQWVSGGIKLPNTYYIDIKGDTLHNLYFTDTEIPEWYNSKSNEGWLVYYGNSLFRKRDSLVLVDASPTYKVFRASHGVAVEKGNSYVWVFISDYRLIDVPGKLRWESIGKIKLVNKHIIVQLIDLASSNPIFIIDIENGISGRLRNDDNFPQSYTVVDKDKIIIENYAGKESYELEKLFNELNK